MTLSFQGRPPAGTDGFRMRPLLAASSVRTTALVVMIPAAILAAISVLAPLQQHRLGSSVGEIAATFGLAAAAGILIRPIFGRWADRRGPLGPVRFGLLASFPVVLLIPWLDGRLAVSVAVIVALVLIGVLWAPLLVMLSDACIAAGVGQVMAVGVLNLAWPPGNAIGSASAGAIAQAAGPRWAYAAVATPLLLAFVAISRDTNSATQEVTLPPSR
jgi:predicted MFS family arabinose efflux permease